jgi:hypothetical protein
MARGRPSGPQKIQWEISINAAVAAEVDLLLLDPVTQSLPVGRRSQFIESLIYDFLEKRRQRLTQDSQNANLPGAN